MSHASWRQLQQRCIWSVYATGWMLVKPLKLYLSGLTHSLWSTLSLHFESLSVMQLAMLLINVAIMPFFILLISDIPEGLDPLLCDIHTATLNDDVAKVFHELGSLSSTIFSQCFLWCWNDFSFALAAPYSACREIWIHGLYEYNVNCVILWYPAPVRCSRNLSYISL